MMCKQSGVAFTLGLMTLLSLSLLLKVSAHEQTPLDEHKPVCLKEYPTDPAQFNELVRPYVTQIIQRHGLEEWEGRFVDQ